jgi:hypothetical protein
MRQEINSLHREYLFETPIRYPFIDEAREGDATMGACTVKICITILAVLLVIAALPYTAVMAG